MGSPALRHCQSLLEEAAQVSELETLKNPMGCWEGPARNELAWRWRPAHMPMAGGGLCCGWLLAGAPGAPGAPGQGSPLGYPWGAESAAHTELSRF